MIRLLVAIAIAFTFPAGPGLAQRDTGQAHIGKGDEARDAGARNSIDDLHDRIDQADGISEEDKERLHQTVDTVKSETDRAREATALVGELQAQGLIANDPAEKAKIDSEVQAQLDRIEEGRRTLQETKQNLEAEIEASSDLTREQKDEVLGTLRDLADKRITEVEAKAVLERLLPHLLSGFQCGQACTTAMVLFILLVIIGAGCSRSGCP